MVMTSSVVTCHTLRLTYEKVSSVDMAWSFINLWQLDMQIRKGSLFKLRKLINKT